MTSGTYRLVIAWTFCALTTAPVFGVPTFFVLQRDTRMVQTGPTTLTPDGFTFQARATPNNGIGPIDFNGGSVSFPASSPLGSSSLSPSGVEFSYSSGKVLDQTTFQTNYPASGTYTFHMTDSTNAGHTQTEAVDDSIGTPVTTVPALTAATFTGLQGMNSSQPFTVNFNSFANPGPGALIFFAIQDSVGNLPVFDGLQPNVTQDVIPAGTLQPGTKYNFFLFFENNAITADNIGQVTFDNRTSGSFTTFPVPEPSGAAMTMGAMGAVLRGRGRRRAT